MTTPVIKRKLGRKAIMKTHGSILRLREDGDQRAVIWKKTLFREADLSAIIISLGLELKPHVSVEQLADNLCNVFTMACERALYEAAQETNAQLKERYRGIAADISAALEKLHYPELKGRHQIKRRDNVYAAKSQTIESLLPYVQRLDVGDGANLDILGLRLASIAIAARNLADDLDRGLDLASDQKRTNYLPVYAHQELAKHGADDELLCGFMIEYVDSFKNPARLNLDGDLNKNSPALCLFKEIIRLAVKRIPLCSKVEIPAAIKMINGIVDLRVGQMGQEPKEDSSIAARLKKAHSEINKLKRKLKIPIFLD